MKRIIPVVCALSLGVALLTRSWPASHRADKVDVNRDWSRLEPIVPRAIEQTASEKKSPLDDVEVVTAPDCESVPAAPVAAREDSVDEPAWLRDLESRCQQLQRMALASVDREILRQRLDFVHACEKQLDEHLVEWLSQRRTNGDELAFQLRTIEHIRIRLNQQAEQLLAALAKLPTTE